MRAQFGGPVLEAMVAPDGESAGLRGARVVALAGIGNPGRFHDLLAGVGAEVVEKISFRDHHAFTQADAAHVLARARAQQADIVTTEKDWVRLAGGSGALAELRGRAIVAPIRLQFEDAELQQLMALLVGALVGRRAGQVERPVRNAG